MMDSAPKNKTLLVALSAAGICLILVACCAALIVGFMIFGDSHPAKLVGAWKGRFNLDTGPVDYIYTFNQDGSFRQESIRPDGTKGMAFEGRWGHRSGQISISWSRDMFERGAVDWIDENSFHYRIVAQDHPQQIGLTTTFKRQ